MKSVAVRSSLLVLQLFNRAVRFVLCGALLAAARTRMARKVCHSVSSSCDEPLHEAASSGLLGDDGGESLAPGVRRRGSLR